MQRPPRQISAQLRFLLDALPHLVKTDDPAALQNELASLHRNLEPEHEFALILSCQPHTQQHGARLR